MGLKKSDKSSTWRKQISNQIANQTFLDELAKQRKEEFQRLLRLRRSEAIELEKSVDEFMKGNTNVMEDIDA